MSDLIDNISDFIGEIDGMMPKGNHTLDLANNMEYAETVHNKRGLYLFNDAKLREGVVKWLKEVIQADLPLNDRNIVLALDGVRYEYIGHLQSLTAKMRPPVKAGEGPRKTHPGGWSDVSGQLANAFQSKIDGKGSVNHEYDG